MDNGSNLHVEWLEWALDCVFQALAVEEHSANWLPEPLNSNMEFSAEEV